MKAAAVAGALLTIVGLVAYVIGVVAPYPGRAFSLTAVMVGLTVLSVGRVPDQEGA
jgi:hypothetical protein